MPAEWREFSWFWIGLPVCILRWLARLGKFKACLSFALTGLKVTSRNVGHVAGAHDKKKFSTKIHIFSMSI